MSNEVDLGFSGISVPPGTHFCAFFRGFTRPEMVTYWETEAADLLVSGAWPFARYTGEMTVAVNQTHRMVLMGDTILENMYFVEPDEFDRTHA
jgi:hypothetical protein